MRTARAKGVSRRAALWRDALPNALVPVLTIMGLQFANLIAGAIVIENVFVLPGLGRLMLQSISNRDTLVVQDGVMLTAILVIGLNFLVDVACAAIDPRLRSRAGVSGYPRGGLSLWLGAALVAALLLMAAVSFVWTPYPPAAIDIPHKLAPPSLAHWFGTDNLGRDVASQIIAGARVSILVGVVAVGIGLVFGVALGLFAAFRKGVVEDALMKACDFVFAFPALLSAIMLTATFGAGVVNAIVAIGIANVPIIAKLTRATANSVLAREYALAARAAGRGPLIIAFDHVLPNIAPALIVQATIQFAIAILAEAALSYLGLGAQPPQASWGRMVVRRAERALQRAASGDLSRRRHRAQRARPQSSRRRFARRARPSSRRGRESCSRSTELVVDLPVEDGAVRIVNGASFRLGEGESLGVVGKSGSGKTMTALALMGLAPEGARIGGSIRFEGRELVGLERGGAAPLARRPDRHGLPGADDRAEPVAPRRRPGRRAAGPASRPEPQGGHAEAVRLLEHVRDRRPRARRAALSVRPLGRRAAAGADRHGDRLRPAARHRRRADDGARRHRAGAHSRADRRPRAESKTALILVSHDLAVVAGHCDRVIVMYGGLILESGPVDAVLREPRNPYTRALLEARPQPGAPRGARLKTIPGSPPHHREVGSGCPFAGALRADGRRLPRRRPAGGRLRPRAGLALLARERLARGMSARPLLDIAEVFRAYRLQSAAALRAGSAPPRAERREPAVFAGRSFGIVGKSGWGKSTLARIALALDEPDRRRGAGSKDARCSTGVGRELRARAGAHADDLPGPVRLARSADASREDRRRAARRARGASRPERRTRVAEGLQAVGLRRRRRGQISARILGRAAPSGSPSPAR